MEEMSMNSVRVVNLKFNFNNKGLKKLFPKTIIRKKELTLGEIDPKILGGMIRSVSELKNDYERFVIKDLDLSGEFNSWDLEIKINLY